MEIIITDKAWKHIQKRHDTITKLSIYEAMNDPLKDIYDPWDDNRDDVAIAIVGYSDDIKTLVHVVIDKNNYFTTARVVTAWEANGSYYKSYYNSNKRRW
ncbi:MAG: hypothetical protein QM571_04915 [Micrococcaceae bacterium]